MSVTESGDGNINIKISDDNNIDFTDDNIDQQVGIDGERHKNTDTSGDDTDPTSIMKRQVRNAREQQRSIKISQHINQLKSLLQSSGVHVIKLFLLIFS